MLPAKQRAYQHRVDQSNNDRNADCTQNQELESSRIASQTGNWHQPKASNQQNQNDHTIEYGYDVTSLFQFKPLQPDNPPTSVTGAAPRGNQSTLSRAGETSLRRSRHAPKKPPGNAWRHFKSDTRAGRLLRQLYEVEGDAPKVNYPMLRTQKSRKLQDRPRWFMGANNPDHVDPRTKSERKQRVDAFKVPKPVSGRPKAKRVSDIERIQVRRPKHKIDEEIRDIEVSRENFKPLPRKPVATEAEKQKLLAYFQFKGGKGLPEEGTLRPLDGELPLSLVTGKPSAAYAKRLRIKQRAENEKEQKIRNKQKREHLQQQFDAVAAEIEKHKMSLEQAVGNNIQNRVVVKIQGEIQQCVEEMKDLDLQISECS